VLIFSQMARMLDILQDYLTWREYTYERLDGSVRGEERFAAINRFNPDGSGHEIFVSGTRNPTNMHLYPGSDTIWITVEERDELGDDLVPEYFTHIEQGRFYGWPYAYIGPNEDPRRKGERPDLVDRTIRPDVLLPAHGSATGFAFYTGKMFPKEYQGGAFIALHGSWNRANRQGYQISFIPFANGKPSASHAAVPPASASDPG